MFVQAYTAMLPFVLQAAASPHHDQSIFKTSDDCPSGVHIIGIRGTAEEPGFGALKGVVDKIEESLPGSDSLAIDYPGSGISVGDDGELDFNIFQYISSITEGLAKISAEIEDFSQRCPNTRIVILGYSQASIANEARLTCHRN